MILIMYALTQAPSSYTDNSFYPVNTYFQVSAILPSNFRNKILVSQPLQLFDAR